MVTDHSVRAWLLAVLVSLNTAIADQHVVFAVDSTLTADELRATHRVVSDVLQKSDATTRAGMIVFDRVVTQVINLQEASDAFRTDVDNSMAALIADRMNLQQNATSYPARGIERSIAELQKHVASEFRPLVVLFTDQSRLDATNEEIDRQFQWLSMILLRELKEINGALLLVTSAGSIDNRLVKTVLGFSQNLHLSLSSTTAIVEHISSPGSSAQEPAADQMAERLPTDRNTLLPVLMAIGLFSCVVLATVIVDRLRRRSRRREAGQSPAQELADESEHYLPLDTTRQRHFSRAIQHRDTFTPTTPASVSAGTAKNEQSNEARARAEADTVIVQAADNDVNEP